MPSTRGVPLASRRTDALEYPCEYPGEYPCEYPGGVGAPTDRLRLSFD